jgi:hypothetical protein
MPDYNFTRSDRMTEPLYCAVCEYSHADVPDLVLARWRDQDICTDCLENRPGKEEAEAEASGARPFVTPQHVQRQTPPLAALLTFVEMIARLQKDGEPAGFAMEEDEALDSLHELIDWARRLLGPECPIPEGATR